LLHQRRWGARLQTSQTPIKSHVYGSPYIVEISSQSLQYLLGAEVVLLLVSRPDDYPQQKSLTFETPIVFALCTLKTQIS
jgi:hypothetical protein